jgi:hypothetical protein
MRGWIAGQARNDKPRGREWLAGRLRKLGQRAAPIVVENGNQICWVEAFKATTGALPSMHIINEGPRP